MSGLPRSQPDTVVTLSVLDRLIDQDRGSSREASPTRPQSVREMKIALRRDLEWLLNTRRIAVEPEESLRELNRSVYVYGLPDFHGVGIASAKDQAALLRSLQTTVKLFEPRLTNVRVVLLDPPKLNTRLLRFRIEGLLLMDPAPEQISFDTVLDLASADCKIRKDADAG